MRRSRLWAAEVAGGCAMLLILLLGVAAVAGPRTTLRDDFSSYPEGTDGSPKWVRHLGDWVMRKDRCEQRDLSVNGASLFLTAPAFGDLDCSVKFNPSSAGAGVRAAGITFRAVDSLNCYYAYFDAGNSQVLLIRRTREKSWHELARVRGVPITADQWHTARVVCTGPRMQVHLDGKLVAEAEDATFAAGRIGLRCGQGHVLFDDLRIQGTTADDLTAFAVLYDSADESGVPRLKEADDRPIARDGGYWPVLVELKDGSLGAAIRGGAPHLGIGGRLDWIRSRDGGDTWSDPHPIVDSKWDDRNPAVGVMKDGSVVIAYCEASTYDESGRRDENRGKYEPFFVTSKDGGRTWSEEKVLCPELLPTGSPYGRILVLADGTSLMSVYTWEARDGTTERKTVKTPQTVRVLRSADQGRTWGDASYVATGFAEMSLVEAPDGRIVAALRRESGGTAVCESADRGRTWSEPLVVTPEDLHPADLVRLSGGALLMVYGCRRIPCGVQGVLSEDGGRTWAFDRRVALAWSCLSWDSGYPSAVQRKDGTIVMLYYAVGTTDLAGTQCRQVRFSEKQLRASDTRGK